MSFTCPRCGATSHNPNDEAQGYCGRCHWWTGDATLGHPDVIAQAEADGAIGPVEPKPVTRTFAGNILQTLVKMRRAAATLPPLPADHRWAMDTVGGCVGDNCALTVTWTAERSV